MIHKYSYQMILCGLLFLFLLSPVSALAQDEVPVDSTAWKKKLDARLAGSQASYSDNWADGGENSLAFTTSLTGNAIRKTQSWIQKHDLRLALGSLKQGSNDFRKADDLIQWVSTFEYRNDDGFRKWHPTAAFELRTQFAEGFDYSGDEPDKISAFFSPATLTETIGFSYSPEDWYSWLIGFAGKQTIVTMEDFRERYGNGTDVLRFEVGFNTKASVNRDIFENVNLKTGLSVFAGFGQLDKPDVRWENLLTMSVNSWLTVGFELVTFYDLDIDDKVQLKQVLSTGVSLGIL